MKVLYSNGNTYIIKVSEDLYYYGDGKKINAFGINAVQFLRFNPHLRDVSDQKTEISDDIVKKIKKHLDELK